MMSTEQSSTAPLSTGQVSGGHVSADQALEAAKPPIAPGLSPVLGPVVAVLVVALGVLGVQEAIQRVGLTDTSWTSSVLTHLSGHATSFATLMLSLIVLLVGLGLLLVVLRPTGPRALRLTAKTGVYLRAGDLARLAHSLVDGADGVTDVRATASQRTLKVKVSTGLPAAANPSLQQEVELRVASLEAALDSAPRLVVDIENQDAS